jgi:ATP-dependent helicase STH1/SNF2
VERVVKCPLSGLQTFLYQTYRKKAMLQEAEAAELKKNDLVWHMNSHSHSDSKDRDRDRDGAEEKGKLQYSNVLMQLRKLCNHPYLLLEDVKTIPDELYYTYIVAASGKLSLLDGLLKHLLRDGHKVSHNLFYKASH